MTRRLGGTKKSLAAIASLSLAATLACVGATTGCGSSTSNNQPVDSGPDGTGIGNFDGGEDAMLVPDTYVALPDVGVPETAPALATLPAPTFSPAAGALNGPTNVSISDMGLPASGFIYYTTNGTNPNPNSLVYSGPIQVSTGETIRAYASAPGLFNDSPIAAAVYTVTTPISDSGADVGTTGPLTEPIFTPTSSKQTGDFKVAASAPAGSTICYTLDGVTTPTCSGGACTGSSLLYNSVSQIAINGTVTNANGVVDVQAITCATGSTQSAVATQTYTLQVADPAMTQPGPGTVAFGSTPTLSTVTAGASIWYSTSATPPSCITGKQVANPHTFSNGNLPADGLNGATTYLAIGCKAGYAPSNVTTSAYAVQLNAPTFPTAANNGPGTFANTLTAGALVDSNTGTANGGVAASGEWACVTLTSSPASCGTTQGTCGGTSTEIGPAASPGTISKTGTVVTAVACGVGFVGSAPLTGTYTLMLGPPDLTPPGVDANGIPLTVYDIPANDVATFTATAGQASGGKAYDYMCVSKGAAPACGTNACNAGAKIAVNGTVPPTGSASNIIAPNDSWSVIGCSADNSFLSSAITTVAFGGPGVALPPTITPASGNFTTKLAPVVINNDTSAGSYICYTVDGSTAACNLPTGCAGSGTKESPAAAGNATLSSVNVTSGGSGYTSAPSVTFSGGGATATATLTVTAVSLTSGGAGYTTPPTVTIVDAVGAGPSTAGCVQAVLANGAVTSLILDTTSGGCKSTVGYGALDHFTTPTIQFSGGAPTTAAVAQATGSVDFITPVGLGAGYSTPPTVTITGSGSGATASAVTTNSFVATALQSDTGNNTIQAITCNVGEMSPGAVTGSYTFSLASPTFTSLNGTTGNLDGINTINGGQTVLVSTASNFDGELLNITFGAAPVNCGSGLPVGVTQTTNGDHTVTATVVIPTNVTSYTINAVACGTNTSTQATSGVSSAQFETVTTGIPVLTTDQAQVAGLTPGCTVLPCAPQGTWYNTFNVTLTSVSINAPADGTICYTVNNSAPTCGAGGTCSNGTPYTAPFGITQSNTPVKAIACSTVTELAPPQTPRHSSLRSLRR